MAEAFLNKLAAGRLRALSAGTEPAGPLDPDGVAGRPEAGRQQLDEAAKVVHVGQMMLLLQLGSMPPELVRKNTELFAREVLPHVRKLWSEYEDHWWINPLPPEERTSPAPVGVPAGGS